MEKPVFNDLLTNKVTEDETFKDDSVQGKFFKGNYRHVGVEAEERCATCRHLKGHKKCKVVGVDGSRATDIQYDHVCDLWFTRQDQRTVSARQKKGKRQ